MIIDLEIDAVDDKTTYASIHIIPILFVFINLVSLCIFNNIFL